MAKFHIPFRIRVKYSDGMIRFMASVFSVKMTALTHQINAGMCPEYERAE